MRSDSRSSVVAVCLQQEGRTGNATTSATTPGGTNGDSGRESGGD
jgi:hypothetical protein